MAPLLTALVPYALLPALLAMLGHHSATAFALFAGAVVLLVQSAQVTIGIARLPLLCLGGIAALGAALLPVLVLDLDLEASQAVALTPLVGLLVGGLLWLLVRRQGELAKAAVSLPLLLAFVALPAATAESDRNLPGLELEPWLAVAGLSLALLLLIVRRFIGSPAARLHEAAAMAALPAGGLGVDIPAFRAVACLLGGGLAALAGALLALGSAPVMTADSGDWAALAVALFAVGRLGGIRLGGALLAALPLLLLPKLAVILAPTFIDLTLAAALAALVLHLVVRPDGSAVWQPASAAEPIEPLPQARLAER